MANKQKKASKKPVMLLCHFQDGELEGLDNLQGGPSLDKHGIREYSKLDKIIRLPEVREIFHQVAADLEDDGHLSDDMRHTYESAKQQTLPFRETSEEATNPDIRKLEQTGVGGDTKVAWIPESVAHFLIELRHEPSVNPETGLLQFGLGNLNPFRAARNIAREIGKAVGAPRLVPNILKIAGTMAGAAMGGPLGAGVGRLGAGLLMGESINKGLDAGLTHMGRAAIASGLGHAAQSMFPNVTSGLTMPAALASGANAFFNGPLSTMGIANGLGSAMGLGGAGAASGAAKAAGAAGSGGAGLLGNLGGFKNLVGPGIMAAMGLMALKGSKKHHQQEKELHEQRHRDFDTQHTNMGFKRGWEPQVTQYKSNPRFWEPTEMERQHGITAAPFLAEPAGYAHGGRVRPHGSSSLVKGAGKGQDDKIRTKVPEGSYIIDASTVSMFGDGSSEAGGHVLRQFVQKIRRGAKVPHHQKAHHEVSRFDPSLPVFLSNDEFEMDPYTVSLLGDGSNQEGSKMLKHMVKGIRAHKNSNGDRLPPRAKDPFFYIRGR